MYRFLRYIPKNHLSFIAGKLAAIPLPRPLNQVLLKWFVKRYGADPTEAEFDLAQYRSLGAFFTRNLKAEARPIGAGVVSPVDGAIVQFGAIHDELLMQIKGRPYSVHALVNDREISARFVDGYYITLYLAPGDYHHVHAPITGEITESIVIEGSLWPVNQWSVENVERLFCVNERLITVIKGPALEVAVVSVGATNVGAIQAAYDRLRTNSLRRLIRKASIVKRHHRPTIPVRAGDRLATFCMGSTVVLLFPRESFSKAGGWDLGKIRFGTTLGYEHVAVGHSGQ